MLEEGVLSSLMKYTIIKGDFLPNRTIVVSQDIWESFKNTDEFKKRQEEILKVAEKLNNNDCFRRLVDE